MDFYFFLFFHLGKLVSCSKGWTSLRSFFLMLNKLVCCSKGWTSLRSFLNAYKLVCCLKGPNQPALFFLSPPTRYIYREVPLFPVARSSSKSLVRAVSIASSLMRFMSCFFRSRPDPTLILTPTTNLGLHLVVIVDLRENQAKLHLGDLIVGQRGRNAVCDCV